MRRRSLVALALASVAALAAMPLALAQAVPSARPARVGAVRAVTPRAVTPRAAARPAARARRPQPRDLSGGQLIEGHCPPGVARCLAFTFDDGPEHATTPRLLDLLDAHRVKATFFVVGHRLDGEHHALHRAALRETARRGHLIGTHSYHHVLLDGLRPEALAYELDRTAELVRQVTRQRPVLFRAPFGALAGRRSVEAVAARRWTPAYWMIDTHDWEVTSAQAVVDRFRQELAEHPRGGVVLMHDTRPWSVSAFPLIMGVVERRNRELTARGEAPYRIVNLDAFVRPRGSAPLRGEPNAERRLRRAREAAAAR
ncbi:MAG: polysaccharide deacetylase family protein [Polyangiales bacterium]